MHCGRGKITMRQQTHTYSFYNLVVAFLGGVLVTTLTIGLIKYKTNSSLPQVEKPEWASWPALELKPAEEEEQLILPFLKGRISLQKALEDWYRDNSKDLHSYVDFLGENPLPPLSVNIEELFECEKKVDSNGFGRCFKFPYHLYQIGCDPTGCAYFLARQHGKNGEDGDGEYFINADMDEHFRWYISCYSFINPEGARNFCDYLKREWGLNYEIFH